MINTYECIKKPKVINSIHINEWIELIKSSQYSVLIDKARNGLVDYEKTKYSLPCCTINFSYKDYKIDSNILNSTGFIYIDIDTPEFNINTLDKKKVFSYYKSFGGKGYAIIVKVNGITLHNFKDSYIEICKDLNIIDYIDINAIKKSQFNILSHDKDAYLNNNCVAYNFKPINLVESNFTPKPIVYNTKVKKNSIYERTGGKIQEEKKIRYNNLNEIVDANVKNESYHVNWEGYNVIECTIPIKKISIGNRNKFLLSYANNYVWLNKWLSDNRVYETLKKINEIAFTEPLTLKEVSNISYTINKYKNNGSLKPIYSKYKRKIVFNQNVGYSGDEKKEIVLSLNNEKKFLDTQEKISEYINNWDFKVNGKISQSKLSSVSGVNIKTIEKHYSNFKQYISELNQRYKQNL